MRKHTFLAISVETIYLIHTMWKALRIILSFYRLIPLIFIIFEFKLLKSILIRASYAGCYANMYTELNTYANMYTEDMNNLMRIVLENIF